MKKLVAFLLAGAILAAAGIGAFADTVITQVDDGTTEADVEYTAQPAYTVVIPASVTLGDAPVTKQIKIYGADENSEVIISKEQTVKISLTNSANDFNVVNNEGDAISYTVNDKNSVADLAMLLQCEPAQKTAADIVFTKTGEMHYSGTYSDILTFTVSLVSRV